MEERHRAIIKEHTQQLVKDIVVNEAFLAALSTEEIFPPDMEETIRVCTCVCVRVCNYEHMRELTST